MAFSDEAAAKTHFSTVEGSDRIWRAESAERLEVFLRNRLPGTSRESLRRALAAGACEVDGRVRHKGFLLAAGNMVTLDAAVRLTEVHAETITLEVLYEDDELIAVNKPSGMLVHPTSRERSGTVGNALLGMGYSDIRFLHRLDRGTSGVLLAAKHLVRRSPLAKMFEAREVEKSYVAVVSGSVDFSERDVREPIGRTGGRRPPWHVTEGGASAETRLRVLGREGELTALEAIPVTGRTNQIRIHCAWIGCPIVGDVPYGGMAASRLMLHARTLCFPSLAGMRTVRAPLPLDFPPFTLVV